MTRAAVYCRVSTDSQEREGTSLKTQLERCLTYCHDKGYDAIQ
jgi:site-specific DNA recombinase